ncbi:MAG TPA: glycoside hydrolase domain-containing protein, partial [Gemmatimonadales bacterium]|nr:glycoside hydrolase domain-containing protein [Gemmatimonadales bacterium]
KALIAVASWAKDTVPVTLRLDWKRLGVPKSGATLVAHLIEKFQGPAEFKPGDAIPVAPGKGWLLELSAEP